MWYIIFHILIMGSSFLALNVQFVGFLQKSSNIHVKNRWNDSDNNDKWATLQIQ